jgi:transcription termination factor NusB
MFGLEKEKEENKNIFEFDLEKDLKTDPEMAKKILKNIESQVQELKKKLREGFESKDFDQLGMILHAYNALQKVVNRVVD